MAVLKAPPVAPASPSHVEWRRSKQVPRSGDIGSKNCRRNPAFACDILGASACRAGVYAGAEAARKAALSVSRGWLGREGSLAGRFAQDWMHIEQVEGEWEVREYLGTGRAS